MQRARGMHDSGAARAPRLGLAPALRTCMGSESVQGPFAEGHGGAKSNALPHDDASRKIFDTVANTFTYN